MSNSQRCKPFNLELYAVTDQAWCEGISLADKVEQAILGGATIIQLREKLSSTRAFVQLAQSIKRITDSYQVPLIINDRLDIALAVDADGLHIGQQDMPVPMARKLLGKGKILGVSAATIPAARQAEAEGADYIGVGALFPTDTKTDADLVTFRELRHIVRSVSIPVVGIGGINSSNILSLQGSGLSGVAVVSAIFAQQEVRAATRNIKRLTEVLLKDADAGESGNL
ncbi:MAG TPA: thiamine phosphate synthase [Bacillota bacterium]|nr:thiamine phosphate synthase [Bacillota bacterium]